MSPLRLFTPNLQTQIRFLMQHPVPFPINSSCQVSSLDQEELVPGQCSVNQAEVAVQI